MAGRTGGYRLAADSIVAALKKTVFSFKVAVPDQLLLLNPAR